MAITNPTAEPRTDTISVVIPSYRSAGVLPDAIDSVLNQTLPVDEIIVVDDGSEDGTEAVCRKYDGHIRYFHQTNQGASSARNAGLAASRGQWLAFLDADDVWEPEKLEIQFAALQQNPEADFVITASLAWSSHEQGYVAYRWNGPLDPKVLRAELLVRNIFTGLCSSLLIRRPAVEAVGGFASGKACEDRRIAIELLEDHRALILPHALVRQRPGPAHWTDPERHRGEMIRLIEDYGALYEELDSTGRLKRRARARVHERSGMHYLENGDLRSAAHDLIRAACLWPFMPNPWRVLINASLGRLRPRRLSKLGA
ncbi:MAG: glycosyltransferase [Phycisphaerales bacterium]|nr:glycosyltransferase [Phycisphaerales bacterium]